MTPTSCLLIDIDHFKKINDKYGHRSGDLVLKEVSRIIHQSVREIDVLARWGGEEFIVLLPETSSEDAVEIAKRILTSVSHHIFSSFSEQVTVSIGLSSIPSKSIDSAEKLIHVADVALYKAKANGRNRFEQGSL